MQQILQFIFKNSHRLLFLLLLTFSLILTVQSHSYHKSKIISSANFFTGGVYEQISNVNEYFSLKKQNEALAYENARLKSVLFGLKDSTAVTNIDSLSGVNKSNLLVSKVIKNSYNVPENYLTINSGELEGIKVDMGVINDLGIVGIIEKTSSHYATIQSILNKNSRINAKMKKTDHFGTLVWDAKNTGYVQLIDIPRLASVRKGDTIVTGAQSHIFPENINIGTIDKIYIDNETNFYTINVKLFNDMTNLGYVYVIKPQNREEVLKLEAETKKENE